MAFLFNCQLLLAWLALLCLVQAQAEQTASGDVPAIPLMNPKQARRFVEAHEKTAITCTCPLSYSWSCANANTQSAFPTLLIAGECGASWKEPKVF